MIDRLPPHSPEAEQGVLGCALLSPNECIGECIEKLKDDGKEAFYDLRHQTIYERWRDVQRAEPIDVITCSSGSRTSSFWNRSAASRICRKLQDAVPSAANLSYYLDIVRKNICCGK
jgi:replicative DNA helicase